MCRGSRRAGGWARAGMAISKFDLLDCSSEFLFETKTLPAIPVLYLACLVKAEFDIDQFFLYLRGITMEETTRSLQVCCCNTAVFPLPEAPGSSLVCFRLSPLFSSVFPSSCLNTTTAARSAIRPPPPPPARRGGACATPPHPTRDKRERKNEILLMTSAHDDTRKKTHARQQPISAEMEGESQTLTAHALPTSPF